MKNEHRAKASIQPASPSLAEKRAYRPPALVLFGQVGALTNSASGCNMADNPSCETGANMGPPKAD